jgi:hypothetical protein
MHLENTEFLKGFGDPLNVFHDAILGEAVAMTLPESAQQFFSSLLPPKKH